MSKKLETNSADKTVAVPLTLEQVELIQSLLRNEVSGVLTACEGYPPPSVMPNEFATLSAMGDAMAELSSAFGYYTWDGLDG